MQLITVNAAATAVIAIVVTVAPVVDTVTLPITGAPAVEPHPLHANENVVFGNAVPHVIAVVQVAPMEAAVVHPLARLACVAIEPFAPLVRMPCFTAFSVTPACIAVVVPET